MALSFETPSGETLALSPTRCVVAGWTGRDAAKVRHHIEELAEIGVAPPSTTPLFYRAATATLTQSEVVEVLGGDTGGEAEPVILDDGARLWLTLGSDHTDRALEATSVAHSKAVCPKPLARAAWPFDEVAERLDALTLTAEISADGAVWERYQSETVALIRPLRELIATAPGASDGRLGGAALFCGTVPALGGVRPTPWFRAALTDPTTGRSLTLSYRVDVLPVIA